MCYGYAIENAIKYAIKNVIEDVIEFNVIEDGNEDV